MGPLNLIYRVWVGAGAPLQRVGDTPGPNLAGHPPEAVPTQFWHTTHHTTNPQTNNFNFFFFFFFEQELGLEGPGPSPMPRL